MDIVSGALDHYQLAMPQARRYLVEQRRGNEHIVFASDEQHRAGDIPRLLGAEVAASRDDGVHSPGKILCGSACVGFAIGADEVVTIALHRRNGVIYDGAHDLAQLAVGIADRAACSPGQHGAHEIGGLFGHQQGNLAAVAEAE